MTAAIEDRLQWLMKHFTLRTTTFQAGPLDHQSQFDPEPGVGYIHLLQHGGVTVENDGQAAVTISEPSVFFFMNPTHTVIRPMSSDVSIVCATLDFALGAGNPLQGALPDMCCLALHEAPGLANIMGQLAFEVGEHHCGRQAILDHLCAVALILALRELMDQHLLDIGLLAGLADTKLYKALNAVHAEPASNWTLEKLATTAGMSRARFAVRFREVVGMTPAAYLAEWRIGLAQTMLLEDKDVTFIADAVGYGSASALSRAFASRRGLSPTAWIKSHIQSIAASSARAASL